MDVMIVTGGTGGHIYPSIIIGEQLTKRGISVGLITRKDPLAEKILRPSQFTFYYIEGRGFKRSVNPLHIISFFSGFFVGLYQSFILLLQHRPKLVVGMGGYLAPPVVLSARLLLIPAVILEPNVTPGLANKIVAPIVNKVFVSFNKTRDYFPKGKVRIYPTPVRTTILKTDRESAIRDLDLVPQRKNILIFGGSQGAFSINMAMMDALRYLTPIKDKAQVVHITGVDFFSKALNIYEREKYKARVFPYLEHMERAYAVADLAICRSGASTVAEILSLELPSILIPYPYATGNHQFYNAQYLDEAGAAILIRDKELFGERLAGLIISLLNDDTKLGRMKFALKSLKKEQGRERLTFEDFLCRLYLNK